jgi:hypothetical protein
LLNTEHNDGDYNSSYERFSFRIRKETLHRLKDIAEEKEMSLDDLANYVFDTYVDYVPTASKANLLPLSKALVVDLLEGYTEDQIKAIAKRAQKKITKDTVLILRGKYDFQGLVDTYEYWLQVGGLPYRHIITDANNKVTHTFTLQHNMGRKFSHFSAEFLKGYFEPGVTREIECTITDNNVAITVEGRAP